MSKSEVTERQYLESIIDNRFRELSLRCDAIQEATRVAFHTSEKAITKAELASDHRFEGVNEFRAQLADQQRTLISRVEVEALMNTIRETMGTLQMQINEVRQRDSEFVRREPFDLKMKELAKAEDTRRDYLDERLRELDRFRWISMGISAGVGGFAGWLTRLFMRT